VCKQYFWDKAYLTPLASLSDWGCLGESPDKLNIHAITVFLLTSAKISLMSSQADRFPALVRPLKPLSQKRPIGEASLNFTLYFTLLSYDSFRKLQVSVPALSMHSLI